MKLYHEERYRARLEQNAQWRYAQLLLGDGWRPLSEYVYDRNYVYAAGIGGWHDNFILFVGRGGKYSTSDWWLPHNRDVPFQGYVEFWQPLPEGVDPYTHAAEIFPPVEKPVRPPEPVYEPGLPSVKLTPGPRGLLVAMRDGAVLHERGQRWSSWTLQRPGGDREKVTERPLNPLRENAFIARNGMLPTEPDRWYECDWQVTSAGRAWLAANV
ncbi:MULTISPECIES: hypothetical protein [Bradyrhizobium]|uniref:hypothetical protein n=1 Tax=Bradyrhizobium TaxID=374 RepID=UPI001EDC15D6|nr:hypothetical protein [Bradyrhizobium zhengyangense]MCG2645705.1 hypothetical protein [Bradyrhizobium zhengyangense]